MINIAQLILKTHGNNAASEAIVNCEHSHTDWSNNTVTYTFQDSSILFVTKAEVVAL